MRFCGVLICALGVSLWVSPVFAGDRAVYINEENDVFEGTDNQYTNGSRIEFLGAPEDMPGFAAPLLKTLTPWVGEGATWRPVYGAAQLMFTPPDISIPKPPKNERPYAGHLYGYMGLLAETPDRLDVFRLQVGVLGPPSLAEAIQKDLHRHINSPHPEGWDTQIGTQPTLELSYQRVERFSHEEDAPGSPFRIEALPHFRLALGNVNDYAALGATIRFGQNFGGDFGPATGLVGASGAFAGTVPEGFGWSAFFGAEGRAFAHAGLIEGPIFDKRHGPDPQRLVGDLYFGASMNWGAVDLTWTHVIRSKEYTAQRGLDQLGDHVFDSIRLGVRF